MNDNRRQRQGMIILLVLSMLVLFLMLGATLLVIATRARTASRAFLAASDKSQVAPIVPRMMLDEALLLLIRGSRDPATGSVIRESLLGDMYEIPDPVPPPAPNTVVLEKNRVPFRDSRRDTPSATMPNGEPYDAFDDHNPFLSKISGNGTVERAAFQPPGNATVTFQVDNDGDGILDGLWFSATGNSTTLLPAVTSASGSKMSFRVSYLVLDLDGRINVNAHGGTGGGTPIGPASLDIDPSVFKALKGDSLAFIQTGMPALTEGGAAARHHAIIPENFRQPPLLAPAGTGRGIPGRGGNPYSLRLDVDAPRQADVTGAFPTDNPFTLGELERVLRPFDVDWSTLPPRLAAMVTDLDGAARRTLTTESWDVTCAVGRAAPASGAELVPKFDLTGRQHNAGGSVLSKEEFANELFHAIERVAKDDDGTPVPGREQWCANVAEYWAFKAGDPAPGEPPPKINVNGQEVSGVTPHVLPDEKEKWGEGIASPADLLAIPMGTKQDIEQRINADPKLPVFSLIVGDPDVLEADRKDCPGILDAVGIPSRFTATSQNERQLNLVFNKNGDRRNIPVREPGRVNVNTCSDDVWDAVCGGTGPTRNPATPMESVWDVLEDLVPVDHDVRGVNRSLANRRALIATVRSNVFAVWITLEVTDHGLDASTCYRLFAIVDRSIPVNYAQGLNTVRGKDGAGNGGVVKTTDVRDVIRLKRYLN